MLYSVHFIFVDFKIPKLLKLDYIVLPFPTNPDPVLGFQGQR